MTYNVFGGTLNLAQSINLAYSCLVSLLLLTSSASLTLCSAVFLLLAPDAVPSSTSGNCGDSSTVRTDTLLIATLYF